ncbi:hypothetical protein F0562_012043 [Nyssa sinensis]|uniref:HMA domain-containing protein n=1 Tax=Nyssa sinensis TaxID=561372 RepID=A0A5J4ZRR0_9ASTE|nr:hypothetical protein F0562_012043 [Nyssa sinensis]
MEKATKQALIYAENLTLPSSQVIVITANMGCASCRRRVLHITSKMTGVKEYMVDVANEQVIVKGDVEFRCKTRNNALKSKRRKEGRLLSFLFRAISLLDCCRIQIKPSVVY